MFSWPRPKKGAQTGPSVTGHQTGPPDTKPMHSVASAAASSFTEEGRTSPSHEAGVRPGILRPFQRH